MARKMIEGTNPLPDGNIGAPDSAVRPDSKKYVPWMVISTGHAFSAPLEKYKDIKDILGLRNLDENQDGQVETEQNDNNIDVSGALQGVTGLGAQDTRNDAKFRNSFLYYVKLRVIAENGSLTVICDPEKLSTALQGLKGKNIYGKPILRAAYKKHRVFNG